MAVMRLATGSHSGARRTLATELMPRSRAARMTGRCAPRWVSETSAIGPSTQTIEANPADNGKWDSEVSGNTPPLRVARSKTAKGANPMSAAGVATSDEGLRPGREST